MNRPMSRLPGSVALLVTLGLSVLSATAMAEHGGRDRTDRDMESRSDSRKSNDRHDRERVDTKKTNPADSKSREKSHDSELQKTDDKEKETASSAGGNSGSNSSGSNLSGSTAPGATSDSNGTSAANQATVSNGTSSNSGSSGTSGTSGSAVPNSEREIETAIVANVTNPRISTDVDFEGRQRRSGEVIMIGRAEALAAVRAAGYSVISAQPLGAFDETLVRIRVNEGESIERALQALSAIAPNAELAPNHVFRPSQDEVSKQRVSNSALSRKANANALKKALIGVIDTGVDNALSELKHAVIESEGFAEGGYTARLHGTIVAKIASADRAYLAVADVFGVDADNRLIASTDAIARAIDWHLRKHVTVINISIEGPDNAVLAHVIRRAISQGIVITAAAGNNGPAASPAYPAAYPGVIAVTAVDEEGRVYPRANRGNYIAFAARGVRVSVGGGDTAGATVSGTSFAAPVVAAEIARRLAESNGNDAASILMSMQRDATDLGSPGRDNVFGWGMVVTPNAVAAMTR